MKVFVFSTVSHPSIGGIEAFTEMQCREFARAGHIVKLATLTPGPTTPDLTFEVIRRPSLAQFLSLLRWADVHLQNNVSLKYCWPLLVVPRRFVYQHHNVYQGDDGSLSLTDRLKRAVARIAKGIANSHYTAAKLKCRHIVLNPYDDTTFRTLIPWRDRPGELVFLGRLVSQKGGDVLVRALGLLRSRGLRPRLTIIGDGPERTALAALATSADVDRQVQFLGVLHGEALAQELNRHRFIVVPSTYEEPFGIVALEGLACGCVPIVSERGGLVDAIGPHGVAVPNGDAEALAAQIHALVTDPDRAMALLDGAARHLQQFRAAAVAARYIEVFEETVAKR